jgi:hypothetical protein
VFTSPEFLTKTIKNGKAPAKKTSTMTKPLVVVNLQEDSDSEYFVTAVPKRVNARGKKARENKENVSQDDDPFEEKCRKRKTTKEPPKEKKRECHDILEMFRKGQKKGSSNRKNQVRGAHPPAPISAGSSPVSKKQRQSPLAQPLSPHVVVFAADEHAITPPAPAVREKTPPADAPPEIAPEEDAPQMPTADMVLVEPFRTTLDFEGVLYDENLFNASPEVII